MPAFSLLVFEGWLANFYVFSSPIFSSSPVIPSSLRTARARQTASDGAFNHAFYAKFKCV